MTHDVFGVPPPAAGSTTARQELPPVNTWSSGDTRSGWLGGWSARGEAEGLAASGALGASFLGADTWDARPTRAELDAQVASVRTQSAPFPVTAEGQPEAASQEAPEGHGEPVMLPGPGGEGASPSRHPSDAFCEWLKARFRCDERTGLILAFVVVNAANYVFHERVGASRVATGAINPSSVVVYKNVVTLVLALLLCLGVEGRAAIATVFSWTMLWRFLAIGALFAVSSLCQQSAFALGAIRGAVTTAGYMYMPMAAVLSVLVLRRSYGILEWLSLAILTLATITLIDLRNEGKDTHDSLGSLHWRSLSLVAGSASTSALGSILAERCYKNRSRGIRANVAALSPGGDSDLHFWIYMAHFSMVGTLVSAGYWALPDPLRLGLPESPKWFGDWGWQEVCGSLLMVGEGWLAGLVVKYFSTVSRAILDTLVTVFIVLVVDPLLRDFEFKSGAVTCLLLAAVCVMSALIFQTGRLNIQALLRAMQLSRQAGGGPALDRSPSVALDIWPSGGLSWETIRPGLKQYGCVIVFVIADAGRTLTQQFALSRTMITPQSMVLACYLGGVSFASLVIVCTAGSLGQSLEGLRLAYSPRKILKYLPPAAFFALAQTMMSLAYAAGVSAAVSTAIGYVYMPISALASSRVLGKYYTWLEWMGLLILTLASSVFGLLENSYSSNAGGAETKLSSILFIVGSACASVMGSLVAERVLKEENLPFYIQKVRLDMGSIATTLVLFPVIGYISSRPQDAFWRERPLSKDCRCADGCGSSTCECSCGAGVFVAWGSWVVVGALAVNILQSWLTGVVIKEFSTVMRAIAQSSTILVIYFIGDPLLNGFSRLAWPLTFVACLVPCSTTTFMVSVSEMEKAAAAAAAGSVGAGGGGRGGGAGGSSGTAELPLLDEAVARRVGARS